MSPRPPTLREKRRYILAYIEPAGINIDQKDLYYVVTDAINCDGQKVDVIEKGFKNTHRLFLTREDLEEL
jgi:hypothetical protein